MSDVKVALIERLMAFFSHARLTMNDFKKVSFVCVLVSPGYRYGLPFFCIHCGRGNALALPLRLTHDAGFVGASMSWA
jgi:hypothetical protein